MTMDHVATLLIAVGVALAGIINVIQRNDIDDIEDRFDEPSTCGIGPDDTLTRDEVYPIEETGDE